MARKWMSNKKRTRYIAIHNHRFGASTYQILSNHFPTEEEITSICKIDFEPNRDEWIDITEAGKTFII